MRLPPNQPNTPTVPAPSDGFDKRLTEEYKILQDKVDKIGAFRFTIKGWSVTAVIALSAASNSVTSLITLFAISFGLAGLMVFFFRMEFEQVRLRTFLVYRAKKLEKAFVRLSRKSGAKVTPLIAVPYLATELEHNSRSQRILDAAHRRNRWILWRASDIWYYAILFCLSFTPLLVHHSDIGRRWRTLQLWPTLSQAGPTTTKKVR